MLEKTREQTWVDWVAAQDVDHFQERLNVATEDDKYKILAQLLSEELGELITAPQSKSLNRAPLPIAFPLHRMNAHA